MIKTHDTWGLSEKGKNDVNRHKEKIDKHIRENIKDVIAEESIITKREGKKVRIPVRGLKDWRFKYNLNKGNSGGIGEGDGNPGDIIGRRPKQGQGQSGAGNKPGEDYMETEVDIDYLIDIMFEDLGLPYIEEKTKVEQMVPTGWKFDKITKTGIQPRIHKKKTVRESIQRNMAYVGEIIRETKCSEVDAEKALSQSQGDIEKAIEIIRTGKLNKNTDWNFMIEDDDLRFKNITENVEYHSNAAVIAMIDTSGCYSEDTEVLTKRGWVFFKDVDENDYFATRNQETKMFEWQKATDYISYDYNGELYNFYSDYTDLAVTPNHRMLITKRLQNSWKECILTAEELSNYSCSTNFGNYSIPNNSVWNGKEIQTRKFGKYEISGDDYCAFLGMYLSEGSLRRKRGRIIVAQDKNSYAFEDFKCLINKICEGDFLYYGTQFEIKWDEFCDYLSPLGTRAFNKNIPMDIMNATTEQIKIFWHYYWLGDGSKASSGLKEDSVINTTSKIIRDQLLELSQKMGFKANYSIDNRNLIGKIIKTNGREYIQKTSHPCFRIVKYETNKTSFNIKKIPYNGRVYCVSVPNTILYVRRNGKPAWCGNSMDTSKKYLARSMLFWLVEFLRKTYQNVEIKFIAHTTDAKVVDEETFFKRGESGGTLCYSAFNLANYVIDTEFPTDQWNTYVIHISDGECWDLDETVSSVKETIKRNVNMIAYCEVLPTVTATVNLVNKLFGYMNPQSTSLLDKMKAAFSLSAIPSLRDEAEFYKNDKMHFLACKITDKAHIYPALKHILFEKRK